MLLGILSDTHNRPDAARAGILALQAAGAEFFVHCGDVGDEAVIDCLTGLPNAVVWGNNDFERDRLGKYAKSVGVTIHEPYAQLLLAGKRIAVTHGDDASILRRVIRDHLADYLLFGHTHVPSDERYDGVRIINPGALYRATPKTVAVLNLATDELKTIVVTVK